MSTSLLQINLAAAFREKFFTVTLWLFSFYLIWGNFFRFLRFGVFKDNLLLSEFIVYSFCAFCFLLLGRIVNIRLLLVAVVIFFSYFQGAIFNGFHIKPLLYAMRLAAMVLSGWVLGRILFERYSNNLKGFCEFWIKIYLKCCLLGFLIFFIFPESFTFWMFLRKFGIFIEGDPHCGRFVSPYFDPNYYSAIVVIPFLFSWQLKKMDFRHRYRYLYILFFASMLLTWSRSGIATFAGMVVYLGLEKLLTVLKIRKTSLAVFFSLLLIIFAIGIFSSRELYFFLDRMFHVYKDSTALSRLHNFHLGLQFFIDHPLGLGYNYLSVLLAEYTCLSSVDSSLLATLICYGAVFFVIFFALFAYFSLLEYLRFKSVRHLDPQLFALFKCFLVYLMVVVFFTSQFNNILYYQFWLIPMIAIFHYMHLYRKKIVADAKRLSA